MNLMNAPSQRRTKYLSKQEFKKIPKSKLPLNSIIHGDCEKVVEKFPKETIDLIITSPPYSDKRKKTYGGIHPDDYSSWFLPKTKQFLKVLKPKGTFILNLKEGVFAGERHTYVLQVILELKKQGWLWTEEYIWHKKNSYPGKWPNRFRDAWERCLQFNKQRKFKMYQEKVMIPKGKWADIRFKNLSKEDKIRRESGVASGFGRKVSNWAERDKVYPTNVLHLATEGSNKNHSAAFPITLPSWFISLFTKKGDVILDPFIGSGTSAVAAKMLDRNFIGIDTKAYFCKSAVKRIESS